MYFVMGVVLYSYIPFYHSTKERTTIWRFQSMFLKT